MLCIRYNCGLVYYRAGVLVCPDCQHEEPVTCPTDELGTFFFHEFVALAYGEDFHV